MADANPFDQFDKPTSSGGNPFDQFDKPSAKPEGASSIGKAFAKGVGSEVAGVGKTLGLAASTLARPFGEEAQNAAFKYLVDPAAKAQEELAPTAEESQSIPQSVARGVGGLATWLAPISKVGKMQGAIEEGASLASRLGHGATSMAPMAVNAGVNTASELANKGVDLPTAYEAGLGSAATTAATGAVPLSMAGGLLKRVGTGAAVGAGVGEAQRQTQNAILSDHPELQSQFSVPGAVTNAAVGGLLGGALGPRAKGAAEPVPETTPEAKPLSLPNPEAPVGSKTGVSGDNTMYAFSDGSVGTQKQIDDHLSNFAPTDQPSERARLMYGAKRVDPEPEKPFPNATAETPLSASVNVGHESGAVVKTENGALESAIHAGDTVPEVSGKTTPAQDKATLKTADELLAKHTPLAESKSLPEPLKAKSETIADKAQEAKDAIEAKQKEKEDALQKSGSGKVLQREQGQAGSAGSESGRVEQVEQGAKPAEQSKTGTEAGSTPPAKVDKSAALRTKPKEQVSEKAAKAVETQSESKPPVAPTRTEPAATTVATGKSPSGAGVQEVPHVQQLADGRHVAVGFSREQLIKAGADERSIDAKGRGVFPAKTNKIQLERALGISKLPKDAVLAEGDKPFATAKQARTVRDTTAKMSKTHEVTKIEGGFALIPKEGNKNDVKQSRSAIERDAQDSSDSENTTKRSNVNESNRKHSNALQEALPGLTVTPVYRPGLERPDVGENGRSGNTDIRVEHVGSRAGNSKKDNSALLAEKVASIFGKDVVWVEIKDKENKKYLTQGAIITRGMSDKIFVNVDSPVAAHSVVGHELTHHMKIDAPLIYAKLEKAIEKLLRNDKAYRDRYNLSDHSISDLHEEMIGDIVGDSIAHPKFWSDLARANQDSVRAIGDKVIGWLNKLIAKLTKITGFGSEKFVSDVVIARRAVADAMGKYALNRKGARENDANELYREAYGKPKFSIGKSRLLKQNEPEPTEPNLTERIKSVGESVMSGFKNLSDTYKSTTPYGSMKKIVNTLVGSNQINGLEVHKAVKDLRREFTDDRLKAMAHYLDAGGDEALLRQRSANVPDKYRKEFQDAARLTAREKEAVKQIENEQKETGQLMVDHGMIQSLVQNYVRGAWKRVTVEGNKLQAQANSGILNDKPKEAMKKIYDSIYDGIMAGNVPEDTSLAYRYALAQMSVNRAIAAKKALTSMMGAKSLDGRPVVIVGGAGRMVEGEGEGKPFLVKPNAKGADMNDYRLHPDAALRGWKWLEKTPDGTNVLMEGNMYIHPAEYDKIHALLGRSAIRDFAFGTDVPIIGGMRPGDLALKTGAYIKGTMLTGTPFHQFHVGEHAVFHGVNPMNTPEISFNSPKFSNQKEAEDFANAIWLKDKNTVWAKDHGGDKDARNSIEVSKDKDGKFILKINGEEASLTKEGVNHGMMVYNHNALSEFGEGLNGGGLLHSLERMVGGKLKMGKMPIVGDGLQRYGEYLFQDYIPRLKAAMFEKAVMRAIDRNKEELASGKVTMDQIFAREAKHSNDAFGEQNYKAMGRNPTTQDLMRLLLLAPDFLESRLKFFGSSVHGITNKTSREQTWAIVKGAAIMGVGAQMVNMMFGDDHKMHLDRPFSAIIGGKEYSPRSVVGDIAHAITDPRGFAYNRLNPVWTKGAFELSTGRDVNGQKEDTETAIKNVAKSWVPLFAQGAFKQAHGQTKLQSTVEALLSSIGITNKKSKTPAEKEIADISFNTRTIGGQLPGSKKRYEEFVSLEDSFMKGELATMADVRAKARADGIVLSKDQLKQIAISRDETPATKQQILEHKMKNFAPESILQVWGKMSDDEKPLYRRFMMRKILHSRTLNPQDKKAALDELRQ